MSEDSQLLADDADASDGDLATPFGRDILVVDDNETNLIAIEAALAPLDRKLVLARSGVEALARLLEQDFALIILDVAMPGMDGFEVARLIRSRDRNRATPIIFITGLSWQDDEVIRGYQLGAFDFLMKPIRAEVLRAKAMVFVQLQERTIQLREKAEELRQAQQRAHERELVMQRKRWEAEAMEVQMQHMAEQDRRKDEFLAILAHELRNPLQPLQTAVELLEQDTGAPVTPRIRGIIQRQVHVIGRLVDDLLDVARFTAGKLELRREVVALDKIAHEAVETARSAADQRGHTIQFLRRDRHCVEDIGEAVASEIFGFAHGGHRDGAAHRHTARDVHALGGFQMRAQRYAQRIGFFAHACDVALHARPVQHQRRRIDLI